jgi:hypothetical protein
MEIDLVKYNLIETIRKEYNDLLKQRMDIEMKRELLTKMLLRLDAILSENQPFIREQRKKLVVRINKTLDEL